MADGAFVIYIGAGAWLPGVPARDMTRDEWEALSAEERETALKLDLYQIVKPKAAAPKADAEKKE